MRYLARAVKYFLQITLLVAVVIGILMALGYVSKDIDTAFTHGWKSVGYILAAFAAISAVYPLFGYTKRSVAAPGDPAQWWPVIREAMQGRGYLVEKSGPDVTTFRLVSTVNRLSRLFEDRITVSQELGGFQLEGPAKDLARTASAIEYKIRG